MSDLAGSNSIGEERMNCCPHCNRPFVPDIRIGGSIRQRIFDFVRSRPQGVPREQIEHEIYRGVDDGGPTNANRVVYVTIHHINRKLLTHGLRIFAERGRGAIYKLHELKPAGPAKYPVSPPALGLSEL